MAFTILHTVFIVVFAVGGLGLLGVSLWSAELINKVVMYSLKLTPGSEMADKFRHPPVPIYQRVYMFNLTNYDEVLMGLTPHVEELGPYVFRINMTKTNMSWSEPDATVLRFQQLKTFHFEAEMSNGTLQDEVVTINPILLGIFSQGMQSYFPNRTLFFKKTVGELLYDGFSDPLLEDEDVREEITAPMVDGRVGFLIGTNGTIEGDFEVYSGVGNVSKLNNIISFNNKSVLDHYLPPWNELQGSTNGEIFPPFDPMTLDSVTVFNPQLCVPWKLHRVQQLNVSGLSLTRFGHPRDLFSTKVPTENEVDPNYEDGLFDASICQYDQPVILSLPHFLCVSSNFVEVKGLTPNLEKHGFYFDVYPKLGLTIDMRVQIQVNFRLVGGLSESNIPKVVYPVFWQEVSLEKSDRDSLAEALYARVENTPHIVQVAAGVLAALCFLISTALLAHSLNCCSRGHRSISESNNNNNNETTAAARYDAQNHDVQFGSV